MAAAGAHARDDRLADLPLDRGIVEKRDMLRPRQPDEDLEPGFFRRVEQPERRDGKHPHRIDPGAAHQREVLFDHGELGELLAMAAGAEWAVGHALDEVLALAGKKEFAVDPDPDRIGGRVCRSRQKLAPRGRLDRHAVAVDRAHLASSRVSGRAERLNIVGRRVIAEFICHLRSETKHLADVSRAKRRVTPAGALRAAEPSAAPRPARCG